MGNIKTIYITQGATLTFNVDAQCFNGYGSETVIKANEAVNINDQGNYLMFYTGDMLRYGAIIPSTTFTVQNYYFDSDTIKPISELTADADSGAAPPQVIEVSGDFLTNCTVQMGSDNETINFRVWRQSMYLI